MFLISLSTIHSGITTSIILILISVVVIISGFIISHLLKKLRAVTESLKFKTETGLDLEASIDKQSAEIIELKDIIKYQKKEFDERNRKSEELEANIDSEVLRRTTELHTLLEKSEESNKLKDAFLEKISREVRTPLNAILGFINLLNDPDLSEHDRAYYYKYIHNSGNNLLALIDNIIDFSKLETNELLIEPKKCRIYVMLSDIVDKYRNRILREERDLSIIFNKSDGDLEAIVDCKRVIHIADQLLSNAIKNTAQGKIEVTYKVQSDKHVFQVIDTGIGIDKKYQDIIFERFYQIDSELQDASQGAGLGLTIAKGLVDLLGGKIWVESEAGKGSIFTFTIPFIGVNKLSPSTKNTERSLDWKGKNILIAEDEDSNYHFLEAILKRTKATLIRANDGVQFLEIMNENKNIDLVLLDIKMPGINGFNAIKVVRQQNITIPVIAQTAFNQPEDKQRCLDNGCNDYLSKPIDKELLLNKISRFFQTN